MRDPTPVVDKLKERAKLLPADGKIKGIYIQPEAAALVHDIVRRPHAFVFGCIADKRVPTNRAWELPWKLSQRVGGFEIDRLRRLTRDEWSAALKRPTPLHSFPNRMAKSLRLAVKLICDRYEGDAARIWNDGCSGWVAVRRFREFDGVGDKIANMAANILVRDFGVTFADLSALEVAPDVHILRVFGRLGLVPSDAAQESDAAKKEVMYRARELNPEWPGYLDWPVWEIGKEWCKAGAPKCNACPMKSVCPYAQRQNR